MGVARRPMNTNQEFKERVMQNRTGLDGRHRDVDGRISEKHGNTRVDTLRETYGDNFAHGLRGDMHLDTLLDRKGANSLSDYLKNHDK
jgi:hypothetical protein